MRDEIDEEDDKSKQESYLHDNVDVEKLFASSYQAFMAENYPPELTRIQQQQKLASQCNECLDTVVTNGLKNRNGANVKISGDVPVDK